MNSNQAQYLLKCASGLQKQAEPARNQWWPDVPDGEVGSPPSWLESNVGIPTSGPGLQAFIDGSRGGLLPGEFSDSWKRMYGNEALDTKAINSIKGLMKGQKPRSLSNTPIKN